MTGTILHPLRTDFNAPCRTNKYPREVPQLPWYRTTVPQMLMAGFLPFSAIYVELYYIFASVWGHKVSAADCLPIAQCERPMLRIDTLLAPMCCRCLHLR